MDKASIRFTHSFQDCSSFYASRQQPQTILTADKPAHRQLTNIPVYNGEWWSLDCVRDVKEDEQLVRWAKNRAGEQFIRIPLFSYNFPSSNLSSLLCMGFELATWAISSLPDNRLERVHVVLDNQVYGISEDTYQAWVGIGCQLYG